MSKKVLLFCNDLMPFKGLPTSGGGLRCWQIYNGLKSQGIEVIASMPAFTYLVEKYFDQISEEQKEWLWNWHTQEELLKKANADAVIFASNWDHYGLSKKPDCPLIIDLHGSRFIETSMWNEAVDTDKKVEVLAKADCLLTAGRKQRNYFYGWLVQAGRIPVDEHFIRYIPVSLSPEIPKHSSAEFDIAQSVNFDPLFVSGGGWFPWQDQSTAIFSICEEIKKRNSGRIEIFGTPHETQNLSEEERKIREIYSQVKSLADSSERIKVNGYIAREDLLKIYAKANVAVEVMKYNLERELAFTTRTIEYLWCGMPVLYNDFSEISEHIKEFDAGWAVNPESKQEIAAAIEEIFNDPKKVVQKSVNAQNLIRTKFTWDKTITPLLDFINKPRMQKELKPMKSPIVTRASYLQPSGKFVDVVLNSNNSSIEQQFLIPAEQVDKIELPISVSSAKAKVELNVKGFVKKTFNLTKEDSRLEIELPFYKLPKGGDKLSLEVKLLSNSDSNEEVYLRGLQVAKFPFIKNKVNLEAKDVMGNKTHADSIAVSFVAGSNKYQKYLTMFNRGINMIRTGQYHRLVNALRWRIPVLIQRVKSYVS